MNLSWKGYNKKDLKFILKKEIMQTYNPHLQIEARNNNIVQIAGKKIMPTRKSRDDY